MSPNKPEIIGGPPFKPRVPKFNVKMPGKMSAVIAIFFGIIIVIYVGIRFLFTYVEPYEFGIKEVRLGISSGIQEKIYMPGYAFRVPFKDTIYRFPRHVQVIKLTETGEQRFQSQHIDPMAMIQTSDGFFVDVDVSILYRIVDPYLLITTLGKGTAYLNKGIIPKVQPALKRTLGELTTEEFYDSPLRVAKAQAAKELLNKDLAINGLEVEEVLIRFFRYTPEIQSNIEEKKLQDQLVFKNQSEARAAIELAQVKRVTEEGAANVQITLEEGNAYRVEKEAERDLYVRMKRAQADLLVQLAEAKRTELKNNAMQAVGADRAVALEMAEVLRGLDVIILPSGGANGMNPLDLDGIVKLFGVEDDQ